MLLLAVLQKADRPNKRTVAAPMTWSGLVGGGSLGKYRVRLLVS